MALARSEHSTQRFCHCFCLPPLDIHSLTTGHWLEAWTKLSAFSQANSRQTCSFLDSTFVIYLANAEDRLIARFFECVDPVYPLLQGVIFYAEYDSFWQLPDAEKAEVEHSFLALIMIMLAIGTQFLRLPRDDLTSPQNQHPASELYASACHQALRLGAYLDRTSVQTLQAMVFMTYFLLNANHATAGWAFAGIIIRQAYALGLNREPSLLMGPSLTWYQKVERRRLWFAISNQDSFMSLILRLPPGATHADIDRAMLRTQGGPSLDPPPPSEPDPQEMSVSSSEGHLRSFDSSADTGYVNSLYSMALLIQQTISSPRSLWLPMAGTSRHRSQLLSRFRACYRSFPEVFRAWNEEKVSELYHRDVAGERLFRQTTVLITNYWHSIMLIQQEGTDALVEPLPCKSDMPANEQDYGEALACLKGTLEAAHEALRIFFVSRTLVGSETGIWWVLCHRAFIQAVSQLLLIC